MFKNFNKSAGQASRLLLVLAIVVLVAVVIVYLVMKMAEKPPKPVTPETPTAPLPVYEQTLGDIRLVFESSIDRGNILRASAAINSRYPAKDNLISGEKLIQVTIGAQNIGTETTGNGAWNMGDIIDSGGRIFESLNQSLVAPWLPDSNSCGAAMKPAFDTVMCTKIYEVSKISTGFKVVVKSEKNSALLDLIVH